jgi:ElaB/YqjD/DUF883 family membrane-anchored ribosome-binding protein
MASEDQTSKFVRNASARVESAKEKLGTTTTEARDAIGEVRDTFRDAIDQAIEERPYATLLMALGLGFVLGAIWRK